MGKKNFQFYKEKWTLAGIKQEADLKHLFHTERENHSRQMVLWLDPTFPPTPPPAEKNLTWQISVLKISTAAQLSEGRTQRTPRLNSSHSPALNTPTCSTLLSNESLFLRNQNSIKCSTQYRKGVSKIYSCEIGHFMIRSLHGWKIFQEKWRDLWGF